MSKLAHTRAALVVNGVDLTGAARSVTLNFGAEMLDKTAMGDLTRQMFPGLKVWSITAELNQDFATSATGGGHVVDGTLFGLVGSTGFTVYTQPNATANVSDTNPRFTGTAVLENYNPMQGNVGDMHTAPVTFRSAGALTRATAT